MDEKTRERDMETNNLAYAISYTTILNCVTVEQKDGNIYFTKKLDIDEDYYLKVIVAGVREFDSYDILSDYCDYTLEGIPNIEIVSV
jgi:hypothetical protein